MSFASWAVYAARRTLTLAGLRRRYASRQAGQQSRKTGKQSGAARNEADGAGKQIIESAGNYARNHPAQVAMAACR